MGVAGTGSAATELLVEFDRDGSLPLHEQIEGALRTAIREGRLPSGSALPSTRAFAAQLGISRGVVTEAYGQLAAEGYLRTGQGARARVAATVSPPTHQPVARSLLPSFAYHFHPGLPDLAAFPRESWLRSLRAALRAAPHAALGYGDPRGLPVLRAALADYLGRARGAATDPEQMLVCGGFVQGLALACRVLRARGVERIALEEPGWHVHRLVVEQAGLHAVPVPVDDRGLRVEELARTDVAAVVVTAAHQFPTGHVLARERRAALIAWAEEHERLIVEDDYDAEYRYDRVAVGALQGLAPERVLYIGSASKRLVPGLRLGWMLMPSWLTWPLLSAKALEDAGCETLSQLTLCDFLVRGELDRHLRRMRPRYRRRRATLIAALARHLPDARPGGSAAGLYLPAALPPEVDEAALLSAAAARDVGLEGFSWHYHHHDGPPGILLGYGNLSEPAIEQGVRLLAAAYREVTG